MGGVGTCRSGAPVFRPASRPQAAKLPLLRSLIVRTYPGTAKRHADTGWRWAISIARGDRSAGLQTGIAAGASCHPWCAKSRGDDAGLRRGWRCRSEDRRFGPSLLPPAPCRDWRWEFRPPAGDDAGLKTGAPGVGGVGPSLLSPAPCRDWRREFRPPAGDDAGLKTGAPDRRSFRRGVSCRRTEAVLASITSMKRVAEHVSRPRLRRTPC